MDRRLAIDDVAAAQILGFIVGLVVLTGSMAIAAYFIMTVPGDGPDEQTQRLQGDTHRAIEVLTTTAGEPTTWDGINLSSDDLRRVGLLDPEKLHYADRHKIGKIQDGNLTGTRILESWDLDPTSTALRIEGRVQSVPIGATPGVDTYGVIHGQEASDTLDWPIEETSRDAAELYAKVNPSYTYEKHFWEFGRDTHPSTGLGNTVPDHAYFVETQLFPMMAGIEATYATADHAGGDWGNEDAAVDAFDDYVSEQGAPESATRWHVVANKSPHMIPGNTGPDEIDEHVLTVNWRRTNGNPDSSNGVGLWRVQEGARSTALLGGIEAGTASSATLSFDHLLRIETEDTTVCADESETDCTRIRPSILFWNTTGTEEWTRLSQNPADCAASDVWDDWGNGEQTSSWGSASVDLCEALEHSDDKLWLSLFWDTDCIDGNGDNSTCSSNQVPHGWFVDNIEVTADGSTVYETDFEPPGQRSSQELFVSNGVDHNRTYLPAPDHAEENTIAYIRNMVEAGGNVVALSPDDGEAGASGTPPGEWLSQIGLSSVDTSTSEDVTTEEPTNIVLRYPNDLPETSSDYNQENLSWQNGTPNTPASWSLPSDFEPLTVIQQGPDNATVLHGKPYEGGGRVAALSYNYTSFEDKQLRKDLYENLHASSVFIDPTFEVGDELPDPGTSEIASDRRVLLVGVTPDNKYVVPLEITMWMWKRG